MMESSDKGQEKKNITEFKTFSVPFSLGEAKANISLSSNESNELSKEKIINQAFKFHSDGNIPEAKKCYKNFIDKGFKDYRVFSNYGTILRNLGKLQEAEIFQRKAIEINPDFAEAHYNLGNILYDLRKLKEAEIAIRKAIEINPDFANAYSNLGNILRDLGKLEEAEISQRKAIEINPDFAIAHFNLGTILRDLGKSLEAEIELRKAIAIKPHFAEAYYNLGGILNELGKLQEAEITTRKAIELKPDFFQAHSALGSLLGELGKLKEAAISTRKAIELNPHFAEAHYNLGGMLKNLGNSKEAKKELIKAIELEPNLTKALEQLARELYFDQEYELAIKYLQGSKSLYCQSLYLGCLLCLNREKEFNQKYKELSTKGVCNAEIGGIVEHANHLYGTRKESHFCNEAINYVVIEKVNEESFSSNDLNAMISYINNDKTSLRAQGNLFQGIQTSGNLFSLELPFVKSIRKALEEKIELYKNRFKDSGQSFIYNWPKEYELRSWMISMKNGGFLAPHNHQYGWITGSFYLQVPKSFGIENSGNIAFSYKGPKYPHKDKNFNLTIKKVENRDICIFPSSLFHHTIPFESSEERICFVFDLVQK